MTGKTDTKDPLEQVAGKASDNSSENSDGKLANAAAEQLVDPLAELAVLRAAGQAMEAEVAKLAEVMLKLKLVTQEEVGADGFDPISVACGQLVDLKRASIAEKAKKTRARNQVNVLQSRVTPRKLGPVKKQLPADEIFQLLSDEDEVEIAFSDGESELAGVPAIAVEGSAFVFRRGRLSLNVPSLMLSGPMDERGARALAGYAFLVDGEQVAWAPRLAGQLTLGGGQTYELKDDIILM